MSAMLPVALLFASLGWILSLLQWLHGSQFAGYLMLLFGIAVVLTIVLWLRLLLESETTVAVLRKRSVALRLSLLLAFAFSMTFIMIFMYHWLNEDGHVHGASAGGADVAQSGKTVGQSGVVTVFSDVHVRGYRLPLKASLNHTRFDLLANKPQSLVLTVTNTAAKPLPLRLAAKAAPTGVKSLLHYPLLHHDYTFTLLPGESKQFDYTLSIAADFPLELQPFTLTHFVFGQDDVSAWQKMQAPLLSGKS